MNKYINFKKLSLIFVGILISISFFSFKTDAAAPTSGLVGYWPMDEGLGTVTADSSGNGNNGTINGATWTSGKISGGINFDGTNDYVEFSTNPFATPSTICMWFNTSRVDVWTALVADNDFSFGVYSNGNLILTQDGGGVNTIYSSVAVSANTWYHACAVRPGNGTGTFYINGAWSGTGSIGTYGASIGPGVGSWRAGDGLFFNGSIDDVRVYNRALSNQEVLDVYNDIGAPPPPPTLTAPSISSFSSSPSSITSGQSSTLSWSVSGNPTPTLSISPGNPSTSSGSTTVTPSITTTYILTATNSQGSVTANTTVAVTAPPLPDTQAPTVPAGLSATAISSSQINLSWIVSADNVGITGYRIYRGGVQVGTTITNNYNDNNLSPSTSYTYTVSAYDAANNNSSQSTSASATTQATGSSGIISADRLVTWQGNVGVAGGIPNYPCAVTLPANSSAATINSNLSSIAANRAVCLQAGSGTWTEAIDIPSNKVLRGSKDSNGNIATLISTSNDWPNYVNMGGNWADPTLCVALSSNGVKGQNSVQVATKPACLAPGAILYISELDDAGAGLVNNNGDEGVGTHYDTGRSLGHLVKIISVAGSSNSYTVNFELPLAYSFKTANSAQLKSAGSNWRSYNGLENMQITGLVHANEIMGSSISMGFSSNSWVKNIKLINGIGGAGVSLYTTYRNEVRDSFFNDSTYYGAGRGYGASLYYYSTANLVENNIYRRYHVGPLINYGGAYNVIGYNYVREGVADGGAYSGFGTHGSHTYMNLFEGNYTTHGAGFDFTHGSGSHETLFRNRLMGENVSFVSAIHIQGWNRYINIVGNVLGETEVHNGYKNTCTSGGASVPVLLLGDSATLPCDTNVETLNATHTLVHGNYAYCTSGTGCNIQSWESDISNHTIPNSYYLSLKPAFFGNLTWPSIDPSNPYGATIPAKLAYEAGKTPGEYYSSSSTPPPPDTTPPSAPTGVVVN